MKALSCRKYLIKVTYNDYLGSNGESYKFFLTDDFGEAMKAAEDICSNQHSDLSLTSIKSVETLDTNLNLIIDTETKEIV